jgi:hypothetical protein
VFGDAGYGGLELGCEGTPLSGVALIAAANSRESSFAGSYDPMISVWISDAFSEEYAGAVAGSLRANLAELYAGVYLRVPGSHVSFYNAAHAGRVSGVEIGEFFTPR